MLNKAVEMFNAANPDIIVKHTAFENTAYETALRTFRRRHAADIAEVNAGSNAFRYAQSGQLTDLSDFVKPIKRSSGQPRTMYRYGGKSYGVLWGLKLGNVLCYNPAMLKERGIDPASLATRKASCRRRRPSTMPAWRRSPSATATCGPAIDYFNRLLHNAT